MWKVRLVRFIHVVSIWLFWPALLLIAWGELTPQAITPEIFFGMDKLEHFTAYFGLAAMACLALGFQRKLAWSVLGIIALSAVLEVIQDYVGRDPEALDFIANAVGALSGLGAGVLFLWLLDPLVGMARTE